jgi:RNA 2',3'-cyclic 3'-phosphodiesterase
MRLFTAIDISDDVREELRTLLNRLRPLAKLKWSPVENMHITTKFIGEWPEQRLEEIKRVLDSVAVPEAIGIEVRGLGWFPNPNRPRVFWAGVHAAGTLPALAHATDQALASLGVPAEDRPYSPHLTLARLREPIALDGLRRAIAGFETHSFGTFQAEAYSLYLSAGGKYTRLAEFSLNRPC